MTDEQNQQILIDPRDLPALRRRGTFWLALLVILFAIASGSAYLWLNYGDRIRLAGLDTTPATTLGIVAGEDTVSRADFQTFKQQTADFQRSTIEGLETQKADLKTLSDRVAALSAKLDALQSAPSSMPVQIPTAPAATPVTPPRQNVAQRKKPSAPKPAGAISVGGAPLPSR